MRRAPRQRHRRHHSRRLLRPRGRGSTSALCCTPRATSQLERQPAAQPAGRVTGGERPGEPRLKYLKKSWGLTGRTRGAPSSSTQTRRSNGAASAQAGMRGAEGGGLRSARAPLPEPWQFDGRLGAMIHDADDFTEGAEGAPADKPQRICHLRPSPNLEIGGIVCFGYRLF